MERKQEAVEQYLRRATRGLWGRKRREVREELQAHLEERTLAHRIGGVNEEQALARTLVELGDPGQVQAGMLRLYTLPTVAGSGVALAALCALTVALLPSSTAQSVTGTFFWPSARCVQTLAEVPLTASSEDCFVADNSLWVSEGALRQALEPQGVEFAEAPSSLPRYASLTFPNTTPIYVNFGRPNVFVSDEMGRDVPPVPGYLSLWTLMETAGHQRDLRIEVRGWDNPAIVLNGASFQIGTATAPMDGNEFYENYLDAVFFKNLLSAVPGDYVDNVIPRLDKVGNPAFDATALRHVSLIAPDGEPGVYGLVTRLDVNGPLAHQLGPDDEPWDVSFMLSVAHTDADGSLTFEVPRSSLRLVKTFAPKEPQGTSVFVRLGGGVATGGGWYEVIEPGLVREAADN